MTPRKTAADYAAIAVAPVLIFLMISSLASFLMLVLYRGGFQQRLTWILLMYTMGAVSVARIAIERDRAYSLGYAGALGLATFVSMLRFLDSAIFSAFILVVIAYLADVIVRDCTLIEDDVDASGQGLIDSGRLFLKKQVQPESASSETETAISESVATDPRPTRRKRKKNHQPGRTVLYLALGALPLFGFGQFLIRNDRVTWGQAQRLLAFYLFAALSLMVTTSFLGLRRYLRQRNTEMPKDVSVAWLSGGLGLIAAVLFIAYIAPMPGRAIASFELPSFGSPGTTTASRYGWGKEGADQSSPDASKTMDDPYADQKEVDGFTSQQGAPPGDAGTGNRQDGPTGDQKGGKKKSGGGDDSSSKGQSSSKNSSQSKSQSQAKQSNSGKQSDSGKASPSQASKQQGGQSENQSKAKQSQGEQRQTPPSESARNPNNRSSDGQQPPRQGNQDPGNQSQRNQGQENNRQENKRRQQGDQSQPGRNDNSDRQQRADQSSSEQSNESSSENRNDDTSESSRPNDASSQNSNSDQRRESRESQAAQSNDSGGQNSGSESSLSNSVAGAMSMVGSFIKLLVFLVLAGIVGTFLWTHRHLIKEWLTNLLGQNETEKSESFEEFLEEVTQVPPRSFSSFRNPIGKEADLRRIVVITFQAFEAWTREHGTARERDETPAEFMRRVNKSLPQVSAPASQLIDAYNRIVYGRGTATDQDLAAVNQVWHAMQSQV